MDDLKQHIIISFKVNYEKYDIDMINNMDEEEIKNAIFKKKICDNPYNNNINMNVVFYFKLCAELL